MATTNWVLFSRARYTLPNFPFPRGRPMSKSCSVHLFVLAERERERESEGSGRKTHLVAWGWSCLPSPPTALATAADLSVLLSRPP